MIFAVFDPPPMTISTNCSFFHIYPVHVFARRGLAHAAWRTAWRQTAATLWQVSAGQYLSVTESAVTAAAAAAALSSGHGDHIAIAGVTSLLEVGSGSCASNSVDIDGRYSRSCIVMGLGVNWH